MYPLFLCTNPYIYISTSYTYMCVHMYIYISIYIYIYIYIYNVYIYISKHSKTCQTPNITPHCQRAKDGIGPELSMAGWFFNRHVYAAAASWTSAPWPKPPDHPVTRSPGHLRSIFGSQKHKKMGFNYHYFKLRWSKKIESGFLNHPCLFSLVSHPRFKFCPNIDPDLLAIWQKLRFICCDPSSRNCWG